MLETPMKEFIGVFYLTEGFCLTNPWQSKGNKKRKKSTHPLENNR